MSTKIDWVRNPDGSQGETWNPLRGCSKVSAGCTNCSAERTAVRFSGPGQPYDGLTRNGRWTGEVRLIEKDLEKPLRWRKPRTVFVCSMSDLFHESVDWGDISRIFRVINSCPQHTFIILTKRPSRLRSWVLRPRTIEWPLPNVWLGVSVEDQRAAEYRIPPLLQIPAAVRWVSVEPMLEKVWIQHLIDTAKIMEVLPEHDPGIHWVVCGAESGIRHRPTDEHWVRHLRDQCQRAEIKFFLKQLWRDGRLTHMPDLDGRVWDEMPEQQG